jgi:hypothetical protein
MKAKNLADLYDLPPVDWERIERRLDQGFSQAPGTGGPDRHTSWLTTLNPDGSPHVAGVGAVWLDGAFWFQTGPATRKGRNLERDPRCALSLATLEFDLVLEGTAARVVDPETVAKLTATWAEGGWPARVDDSGTAITAEFSAPSAGPPPWFVYRITPTAGTALATTEPAGATRWTW